MNDLAINVSYDDYPEGIFYAEARARELIVRRYDSYGTSLKPSGMPPLPGVRLLDTRNQSAAQQVVDVGDALVYAYVNIAGRVGLYVAGKSIKTVEAALAKVKKVLPKHEPQEDRSRVDVRFWTTGNGGPRSVNRAITAPTFDTIEQNYTRSARSPLAHMMSSDFKPGAGGQLLLWWGPPGGGKTFALRALAQAWRDWCDIEYVVDPEQFFGDATYLMPVLLNMTGATSDDRWRLLIFEDTGELLSADARTRAGQGLSRLLNVVDGFIGQGLRTLILITTNEELDRLHPAVSRPGRCAVKANFGSLTAQECRQWGIAQGVHVPSGEHSLAELYAIRDGFYNDDQGASRPIGFRAEAVA